jgi:hypothetical protein
LIFAKTLSALMSALGPGCVKTTLNDMILL